MPNTAHSDGARVNIAIDSPVNEPYRKFGSSESFTPLAIMEAYRSEYSSGWFLREFLIRSIMVERSIVLMRLDTTDARAIGAII